MEQELAAIREKSVKALPELLIQAEKMLKFKGCQVYIAADKSQAQVLLEHILDGQKEVVRSYSKTLGEIGFDGFMKVKDIKVNLTSVTEIIMERIGSPFHGFSAMPYVKANPDQVKKAIKEFLGGTLNSDFQELSQITHRRVKEAITKSEFGITGFNSIAAENGAIILAEDEGNARAVSNLPYKHVAVGGIEKITATAEEAMTTIGGAAAYGTGRKIPNYISLISGPSRTGDIEFRLAFGMHGPKEVHVILLDNGRKSLLEQGYGEILKCIDCGSCLGLCQELALGNKWTDLALTLKGISLALVQGRIKRPRALQYFGNFSCPVGITVERFKEAIGSLEPYMPTD